MSGVRVLFFAGAKIAAGCGEAQLPCGTDGLDEEDFWTQVLASYPSLAGLRGATLLAVNCEYLAPGTRIRPGDEVALIPPVSGG